MLLDGVSLIVIGPMILAGLLAAMQFGFWGHDRLQPQADRGVLPSPTDHLLSAMLGLLALLLGFTFSLALHRFDARRELVVQEANAIGTAWLRAELLEEPVRSQLLPLLRHYADARIAWSADRARLPDMGPTAALQAAIWRRAGQAVRQDSSAQLSRGLIDALNQSFDLASARRAERSATIPAEVLAALLVCALLSAVMLGYMLAAGKRHRLATVMLLTVLTLTLVVIMDLDRPVGGSIEVPRQPLLDLRASI